MSEDDDKTKTTLSQQPSANVESVPTRSDARDLLGHLVGGRYRVLKLIGRGGMGSVYYVEQVFLKKHYALKTFTSVDSDVARLRFQKEAQASSKLDHPNIARVVDFGSIDEVRLFMVMEYIDGPNLSQHLKNEAQLAVPDALEIFIPITFALDHAHKQGVVHRDIKPSNIALMVEGLGQYIPKLLDFGIAKLLQENETDALTKTGEIFGTPLYMSPEQCSGQPVDERSDIYSLGCVLYEALTGAPPFRGRTALETMMMHRSADPMPMSQASLGRKIPDDMQEVVSRMTAKNPSDRYPSCAALAEDLLCLQRGQPLAAQSQLARRSSVKPRWLWLMVAASLLLLVFAVQFGKLYSYSTVHADKKIVLPEYSPPPVYDRESFDGIGLDKDPFSSAVPAGKRRFQFGPQYLGQIELYGNGDTVKKFDAQGTVEIKDKPITFLPSAEFVIDHPSLILRFRPEELSGLSLNDDRKRVHDIERNESLTPYFDSFLAYVGQFPDLRFLDISRTPISGAGLERFDLDRLSHLESLKTGVSMDGRALTKFKIMNQLTQLDISNIKNVHAVLKVIERTKRLEDLNLGQDDLTDDDMASLSHLSSLRSLNINNNREVTAAGLARLADLPHLERLNISATKVKPSSLLTMKWLQRLKWLRVDVKAEADCKKLADFLPSTELKYPIQRDADGL